PPTSVISTLSLHDALPICRNLLDFNDATLDEKGKVLFAYADGCIDGCELGGSNTYSSKATVARQSGGKGLLAQYDSAEPIAPQRDRKSTRLNSSHVSISYA